MAGYGMAARILFEKGSVWDQIIVMDVSGWIDTRRTGMDTVARLNAAKHRRKKFVGRIWSGANCMRPAIGKTDGGNEI